MSHSYPANEAYLQLPPVSEQGAALFPGHRRAAAGREPAAPNPGFRPSRGAGGGEGCYCLTIYLYCRVHTLCYPYITPI